ncbi:sulfotransferase family protein [Jejudonia soesokkakensis]|uniref:Sulfotransferase family protein n=1 Tax=Jejudonia soesokkakensis TaxID=1323432 RepID=A0ABW2MRT1_9FLAO
MEEGKVNLFIVGAMKAGTTSFVEMLSQHPDIYVPPIKEPHYFIEKLPKSLYEPSRFFNLDSYFDKDFPKSLHITKVEKKAHYKKLYSLAKNEKYCVDASTAYLHAPGVSEAIYNYNPSAKIIILLRDPFKRAYSHYKMDLGLGRTSEKFETLIEKEVKQYEANSLPWNSYLGMSFYDRQVKSFIEKFEHVLVIQLEDLLNNSKNELKTLSDFLEISTFRVTEGSTKNISRTLRFQKVFFFLKRVGLKDYFSKIIGTKTRQYLFRISSKKASETIELDEKLKLKVLEIFKSETM